MLQKLIEFGLGDKEARVYLALLELGPSSVTDIARRSKVTRTNTYHLLGGLLAYGLVSSNEGESKVIFAAERPERFLYMMKENLAEAERKYKETEKMMPELKSIFHDPSKKIKVRYYEGVEGIISAYEDTLTSKGKILAYASVEYQHSFSPGYFPAYYERRAKKGIPLECFLAESPGSQKIKDWDKKHLRVTKIVPKKFEISPEINIYDNKVAILSLKEKFGVIVESTEVADAFKRMFELAYERADFYDREYEKRKENDKRNPRA